MQPNFGSIVAKHRGTAGHLPPFFSIASGVVMDGGRRIEGYGGGTLGAAYDPFMVGCSEQGEVNVPALQAARRARTRPASAIAASCSTQLDRRAAPLDADRHREPWNRDVSQRPTTCCAIPRRGRRST